MERNIDIENIVTGTDIKIVKKMENLDLEQIFRISDQGVYVFWTTEREGYVGMSKNTGKRMYQNVYQRWYKASRPTIEVVNTYITEDIQKTWYLEKIMIDRLQPEINSNVDKKNYYNYEYLYKKDILYRWRSEDFERLKFKYNSKESDVEELQKGLIDLENVYYEKLNALEIYDKDRTKDVK